MTNYWRLIVTTRPDLGPVGRGAPTTDKWGPFPPRVAEGVILTLAERHDVVRIELELEETVLDPDPGVNCCDHAPMTCSCGASPQ